jgi:hypothetical protein
MLASYKSSPSPRNSRLLQNVSFHRVPPSSSYSFIPTIPETSPIPPEAQRAFINARLLMKSSNHDFSNSNMSIIIQILDAYPSLASDPSAFPNDSLTLIIKNLGRPTTVLNSALICCNILRVTSSHDSFLVSNPQFSRALHSMILQSQNEVTVILFEICTILLRDLSWRPQLFDIGIYAILPNMYRSSYEQIQAAIATFLLESVNKPGGPPEFLRTVLEITLSIIRTNDSGMSRCGIEILRHLALEIDSVRSILEDGSVIACVIHMFESTTDLFFLEALVRFVTFGDFVCAQCASFLDLCVN